MATERGLVARRRAVLPIPYFHVVFTLPHALNPLAQSHPQLLYRLLFQTAASTLLRFGRDPRHLGGDLGGTAVLHTWGQTALLAQPPPPLAPAESVRELVLRVTGIDIERCPVCPQGVLQPLGRLLPTPVPWDTS